VSDKDHTQDKSHPVLNRLDLLVGEWATEASIEGQLMAKGKTAFEWIEGGLFLAQHSVAGSAPPGAPTEWVAHAPQRATMIIGLDDGTEEFCMLYADSRGVFRVYQMSMNDGVWKLWRDAPGFNQRFTGTFSDDGNTITGQWEFSSDGTNWAKDFDLTYRKISP